VASARGLSPTIAVDRAVRSVLGKAVYPVAGVRCADVPALVQCATGLLETVCGDPGARERIRDALFGPIVLAGAPVGLSNPSEEELTRLPPAHRASLFAWLALRLPLLHVGGQVVDSSAAYLAAIATRRGRDDAAFIISDRSEKAMTFEFGLRAFAGVVGGPLLALFGIWCLLELARSGALPGMR